MDVTLFGIVMFVSDEQLENASRLIDVTPFGMEMFVNDEQP